MSIGKVIQSLREENNISQKELADKIKISYSVMNRIESGERPTRDDEIKRIAKALNVSPNYLLGVSDKTTTIKEETIPEYFDDPQQARKYIERHQIFGADGFELDDEEIVRFANELLQQMKMVSYKYRK